MGRSISLLAFWAWAIKLVPSGQIFATRAASRRWTGPGGPIQHRGAARVAKIWFGRNVKIGWKIRHSRMRGLRPRQGWGRCPQTPWTPRYIGFYSKFVFQYCFELHCISPFLISNCQLYWLEMKVTVFLFLCSIEINVDCVNRREIVLTKCRVLINTIAGKMECWSSYLVTQLKVVESFPAAVS